MLIHGISILTFSIVFSFTTKHFILQFFPFFWNRPHLYQHCLSLNQPHQRTRTKAQGITMAKEMMIVFVYDTECCQNEADDPVDAVLYFHPSWVSDTQKLSLCGQLMGTVHFLRENFGKINVISLQNGKFVLKEFGRFILAVGTDRNISQSLLEHRAELLSSLLCLFHRDIQTMYDQFSATGQYKNLSEKLYHIFETYLPILQYNGNIFQNMPISKLPKSASNIFLEAMHTLQSCQRTAGVLGGSILYHNKIIATQLQSKLVKNLILTDPYRIKTTAETISVKFHVPMGCQLITIFITRSEYNDLLENSDRIQRMSVTTTENGITHGKTNGIIPMTFKKKIMKRDKSIVFKNIPEESVSENATTNMESNNLKINVNNNESQTFIPAPVTVRPNHLPLRFKNITSKDIPESGFSSSITFDEHDSFPQFIGRTSVCSTPMTENKVLHGNILPICGNLYNDISIKTNSINSEETGSGPIESVPEANVTFNKHSATVQIQKPVPKAVNQTMADMEKTLNNNRTKFNEMPNHLMLSMTGPLNQQMHRNSLIDISETFRKFSRHLSLHPISVGFANFMHECDYVADGKVYSNDQSQWNNANCYDYDADIIDDVIDVRRYRTITDPTYPVFNSFGQPISQFLFEENAGKKDDFISKNSTNYFEMKQFAAHENETQIEYDGIVTKKENDVCIVSDNAAIKFERDVSSKFEKPPLPFSEKNIERRSLTLPLKSLTNGITQNDSRVNPAEVPSNESNVNYNIFDKPNDRRKLNGIQLTPLISKLSILATNDERSAGFSSWDTTPGIELATPLDSVKMFRRRSSIKADDIDSIQSLDDGSLRASDSNELIKVELFICGQNNMTMLLVLKEDFGQKQENIQAMFDVCVSKLPRLETNLNQILNINMNEDKTDGGYSFFHIDNDWDTLCRGGPWSNSDLSSMEYIQNDFVTNPKLHNLTLRGEDSVIYGHQNIGSNVFYKQSAQSLLSGLPPPVDVMGTISKQARRHLERDQAIVLF